MPFHNATKPLPISLPLPHGSAGKRDAKLWQKLWVVVVESPSLEIFQTHLDAVLCSLLWVTLLWQGVGLGDPQRSLPAPTMLAFCDLLVLARITWDPKSSLINTQASPACTAPGLLQGQIQPGASPWCVSKDEFSINSGWTR